MGGHTMSLEKIVGDYNLNISKGTIVVVNDIHSPLHSEKSVSVVRQVMKDIKPTHLIINGDFLDSNELSKYIKSKKDFSYEEELKVGRSELTEWAKYAKSTIFSGGNHEWARLENYIKRNAPALEVVTDYVGNKLLSLENLLGFKEKGIQYIENNYFYINNDLLISHLYKSGQFGGYIAKNIGIKYNVDVIHGHSHKAGRVDTHNRTFIDNGCLSLPVHYTNAPDDQVHAFTVVDIINNNKYYQLCKIIDGKTVFGNKTYSA